MRLVGRKVVHQVHTVAQARTAAEHGVDVVVAQGSEAGGQGMADGVGSLALQLAKPFGAGRVIATASTEEKRSLCLSLGADAAVDTVTP